MNNSSSSSSSSRRDDDHFKQVDMFAMSPAYSAPLFAEPSGNSSQAGTGTKLSEYRRMETAEHGRRRLLLSDFNSSSSARQTATQQQQQQQQQQLLIPNGPCLSCLMRALQSSGLLNSCWSAAFSELEEAFAIKRVADAMTGENGGAAGASEGSNPPPQQQPPQFRQQQRLPLGQKFGMEVPLQTESRRQQLPAVGPAATGPGLTKWHALESLCSLLSDIGACQHRTGGAGY